MKKKAAVIVGASHAGVQAALSLRQSGWQDGIVLFSAEADYPYHRPPLSKAFLAGEKDEEQILLRAPALYAEQGIDLRLGEPVEAVDPAAGTVTSRSGTEPYSTLLLATGSRARRLNAAGSELEGIFTLRTLDDSRRLKEALAAAGHVVIVGGGFIGLEFASTSAKLGKQTTVLEALPTLLSRSLPPAMGDFLRAYHESKGVRFRFGAQVAGFEGEGGRLRGVRLADGETIAADIALVGIGGEADLELARSLGLALSAGGIEVDAYGRTSAPGIYAMGDVAGFHNAFATAPMRLESVQNAVDQAKVAAAHICGADAGLTAVPWFWTDQYDLKVQMAGIGRRDATEILRGDPASGAFTLLQLVDGRLVAAHSVNRAADHMISRRLIADGTLIDAAAAADIETPLAKATAGQAAAAPAGR